MRRMIMSAGVSALLIVATALPASADLSPQQQASFTRQLDVSGAATSLLPNGWLKSILKARWDRTCAGLVSPPNNLDYDCTSGGSGPALKSTGPSREGRASVHSTFAELPVRPVPDVRGGYRSQVERQHKEQPREQR